MAGSVSILPFKNEDNKTMNITWDIHAKYLAQIWVNFQYILGIISSFSFFCLS